MDHSVQGYLRRRTNGELLNHLDTCTRLAQWNQCYPYVSLILKILQERDVLVPQPYLDSWNKFVAENPKLFEELEKEQQNTPVILDESLIF